MKIQLANGRAITLRRNDFLAAGGEAAVYARNGVAYKIFPAPSTALRPDKLALLAPLACAAVLAPTELVRDADGEPIGYAMPLVDDAVSLAQLTTRAYRQRVGFTDRDALALVVAMRDAIANIHAAGLVIVDLSPNNVLVRRGGWTPCFIDTDSWQTPVHDATAVTPTIRDPLATGPRFDPGADWFAFAIVTFELLVGIHPFKGKHPRVRGVSARMRAGVSALDPAVKLPPVCAPLDVIPPDLRAWYRNVFERGLRSPPPGVASAPAVAVARVRTTNGAIAVTKIREYPDRIRFAASIHGRLVVATDDTLFVVDAAHPLASATGRVLALGHAAGRPIAIGLADDGRVALDDTITSIPADEIASTRGLAFVRRSGDVFALDVHAPGGPLVAAPRRVASAMPHASALHPGVLLQSVLGATHATLLEGRACPQLRLPELDRLAIVDARHDRGVLVVVTCRDAAFDRFVFRFDASRRGYDCRVTRDVAPIGAVLATTPRGVCILRVDDGLEVFPAAPGTPGIGATTVPFELPADATLLEHEGALLSVHDRTIERLAWTSTPHPAAPTASPSPICRR